MGLTCLNEEFTPVSLPDAARNRATEMTMTKSVEDDLNKALERLSILRPAGLQCMFLVRFIMHYEAGPSCP